MGQRLTARNTTPKPRRIESTARQSDDQRTVQMHRLPRSSLAMPDLTHEPVRTCRSLPRLRAFVFDDASEAGRGGSTDRLAEHTCWPLIRNQPSRYPENLPTNEHEAPWKR